MVSIRGGSWEGPPDSDRVRGSWMDVGLAATQLSMACDRSRKTDPHSRVTGGELLFGDGNGLEILVAVGAVGKIPQG